MADAPRHIRRLVLVYNADSGALAALADSAKKLFRLGGCTLCAITHGLAGEKRDWQEFREALGVPIVAFHRDDVPASLRPVVIDSLPCVAAETDDGAEILLGPDVLARSRGSVADFRGRLETYAAMKSLALG